MPELREDIKSALQSLISQPLREASLVLLATLGYRSDRTLVLEGSKPQAFLDLIESQGGATKFDTEKACFADWKSADILFQLTDEDLAASSSLFKETDIKSGLLRSYLFFAIELKGGEHSRSKLSAIARQINRVFPMPVMVLLKHDRCLSIAVINRRQNKIHADKDVLEKVTLIRDISLIAPHRGHLEILQSIAFAELEHPKKLPIRDFDTLHAAWEQIFNIELLNNRFYKELSNWYFWALPQVDFPDDLEKDDEKRRATGLIRLLTRLIFCWFLKEKDGLIPGKLFDKEELEKILHGFDPESETSSTYYLAILQNLFFATLNQRMGKDSKGSPYRYFATDEGFQKNRATYDINNLYRYENLFAVSQEEAIALFADIPFLNGGLFECLDRTEDGTNKKLYLDGFSRRKEKRPHVPDRLFFDSGETADLSGAYGDKKRKSEQVTGLISILNRYKFTIVENTPIDQEIALDPELLGKVFENLLASYNEETKTTARKQTGSFYTPRPIVDYMVDESLKAHLSRALVEKAGMKEEDARAGLDILFAYTEKEHAFEAPEVATLIAAIDEVKILDPACGSGAFPMGVLHKLVYILGKLDEKNEKWEQIRIDEAQKMSDADERRRRISEIMSNFADNNDDYGRKLYLIENCLYGVDIQPIAIQITKLRFFISLVCDQKTNRNKKENHGIRPLPNLETKFVAANTLISLPEMDQMELVDPRVYKIEAEIETLYHNHFSIQRRDQKIAVQAKVKALRKEMADLLAQSLMSRKKSEHIAEWDPFDPQSSADFFDSHWMFGKSLATGFDIAIGNPPYGANIDSMVTVFEKLYPNTTKSFKDIYKLFIEAGLTQLLRPDGVICYITPNTLLRQPRYKDARAFLNRHRMLQVIDFGFGIFEQVVPTCVFLAAKAKPNAALVRYLDLTERSHFTRDLNSEPPNHISQEKLLDLSHSDMSSTSVKDVELLRLVDVLDLKDAGINYQRVKVGLHDKGNSNLSTRLLYEGQRESAHDVEYWKGVDIGQFHIVESTSRFVRVETVRSLSPNERVVLNREYFAKIPKLIWRQTASHLMAAVDETGRWFGRSIQAAIIKPKFRNLDYFFVLGLLNSSYLRHSYNRRVQEAGRVFPQVKFENLKALLLAIPNNEETQQPIAALARAITAAKKADPAADTSAFEREIDQQVYALYGLTPEEIAIVEGTGK